MKQSAIKSRFLWSLLFIAIILSIATADERTDKVDKLFAKWDSTVSPGAALAIIKDGKIIYKRGYGMANLEHNIPITPATVFRIGSNSKQFTAASIAILSVEGKISLDDDLHRYIPEIPQYEKPITIKHLIYHTSGLRNYTSLLSLKGYRPDGDSLTMEETLEILARQKSLNFDPGEEYSYCNSGYFLMSIIVKRVTGKSLNDFAQERIFKPLGMKNTLFRDNFTMIVKNRADAYSLLEKGFRINTTNWNTMGAGGVYTTVYDFFLWDQAFYNNRLGKELMELIQKPGILNNGKKLDYAFGLRIGKYKGLKTVSHSGSWVGFRSAFIRFPEQRFSVVCLANLSTMSPSSLSRQIADIYLADQFKGPAKETERPRRGAPVEAAKELSLTPAQLEEYAGEYYSEELLTAYRLVINEGALFIKIRNISNMPLKVMAPDRFIWGRRNIDFIRNNSRKITGFKLRTGSDILGFIKK